MMNKNFKHNLYEVLFGLAIGFICICVKFFIEGIKTSNALMISLSVVVAIIMVLLSVFLILTRPYKERKKKKTKRKKKCPTKNSEEK